MIQTTLAYLKEECFHGNLKKAVSFLLQNKKEVLSNSIGKHEVCPEFFYIIQEYDSKDTTVWEAHKKYIDIQLILLGEEIIEVANIDVLQTLGAYDESKDFCGFEGKATSFLHMYPNDLVILFPEDVHKPGLKTEKGTMPIKKCLFKVLV